MGAPHLLRMPRRRRLGRVLPPDNQRAGNLTYVSGVGFAVHSGATTTSGNWAPAAATVAIGVAFEATRLKPLPTDTSTALLTITVPVTATVNRDCESHSGSSSGRRPRSQHVLWGVLIRVR